MKKYTRIMLNSMHHELRTPIHGIQSSLELIKPYISSHANRQYNICRCALQFLLSLVNDTLDYAQMQEGKFRVNTESVPIRQLVKEVYNLI